jgi:hypothetical protein
MIDELSRQPDKTLALQVRLNLNASFVPQPERHVLAHVERIMAVTTPGSRSVEVLAYEK